MGLAQFAIDGPMVGAGLSRNVAYDRPMKFPQIRLLFMKGRFDLVPRMAAFMVSDHPVSPRDPESQYGKTWDPYFFAEQPCVA